MKAVKYLLLLLLLLQTPLYVHAWQGMPTPKLRVDGRYLKDTHGNVVNLHGFAFTPNPWFNYYHWGSSNGYDVSSCLKYMESVIDVLTDTGKGWNCNMVRLHLDPHWTNKPNGGCTSESQYWCFSESRLRKYLDQVFVPLCEIANSHGMYVIMRPPGVCPEVIGDNDEYFDYLMTVWDIVSQHPKIKNSPYIMLELANEPVNIRLADGSVGSNSQAHFDVLKSFFQKIVDKIRNNGADNILWIPGSGWQSHYKGYALNQIEGENIGYAVHIYPGYWGGKLNEYDSFLEAWNENVKPIADIAPIAITEVDWSPDRDLYGTWGEGITGDDDREGFGINFKRVTDMSGNVSWNFLGPENLIDKARPDGEVAYGGLWDACAAPGREWFREYSNKNFPRPDFSSLSCADNGDGTFSNPLIHADFPDPDVIRVGDVYYMVTTTMHIFPGATLLKSSDLVNWEYCSNPLENIILSDGYNLENGANRYSRGQWASSIRYHDGRFYILFNTLDEGGFLLTATDPQGKWSISHLPRGFYDPGLLFDNDGRIYVAHGINTITVTELDDEFHPKGNEKVVLERPGSGLEGSHFYHIGNKYYLYCTYGGWPARQVAFRADNPFGPYQEKVLLDEDNIHQGALVETQTGEWWSIMFYDKGPFGRLPNLQPVSWTDGWPELGINGKAVTTYRKPNVGRYHQRKVLPTTDNFRGYKLAHQWGWNHNPDNSAWSLFENPGWLRLKTTGITDDFLKARNTITQRIFGYHSTITDSYATIRMDISNMMDGDIAGLAIFQDPYSYIGVKATGDIRHLVWYSSESGSVSQTGKEISSPVIYLRAVANYGSGKARFYYSTDNIAYSSLGNEMTMKYDLSIFVGNRFSIFNFATQQEGGFVDVDWFTTEPEFEESAFYDDSFTGFTEEELTLVGIYSANEEIDLLIGTSASLDIMARFMDSHEENISAKASYSGYSESVVNIRNGQIMASGEGVENIIVSYTDLLGNECTTSIKVRVSTFPLTASLFNPSIYESGSFDESTKTLITGQWGFGGWKYTNGVDLSGYDKLVVELVREPGCGVLFRMFDQTSYWTTPASFEMSTRRRLEIDLSSPIYKDAQSLLDLSHIYTVGFWSNGGCPVQIDKIYLTRDALSLESHKSSDPHRKVDVYNVVGAVVRAGVNFERAIDGLPAGIYIIDNEKYVVN